MGGINGALINGGIAVLLGVWSLVTVLTQMFAPIFLIFFVLIDLGAVVPTIWGAIKHRHESSMKSNIAFALGGIGAILSIVAFILIFAL